MSQICHEHLSICSITVYTRKGNARKRPKTCHMQTSIDAPTRSASVTFAWCIRSACAGESGTGLILGGAETTSYKAYSLVHLRLRGHERLEKEENENRTQRACPEIGRPSEEDEQRGHQKKTETDWDHPLPRQLHELVESESRQSPANHHAQEDENEALAQDDAELKQDQEDAAGLEAGPSR